MFCVREIRGQRREAWKQITTHFTIRSTLAQKPVWTRGPECCSWAELAEPFLVVENAETLTNEVVLVSSTGNFTI
jgi:hypothetical protein